VCQARKSVANFDVRPGTISPPALLVYGRPVGPAVAGPSGTAARPATISVFPSHDIDVYSRCLTMPKAELQGALDVLVLKILRRGPNHGFAIASYIQQASDDVLRVEAGSLYPALHRMTDDGLISAAWQRTDAGRRARVYAITAKGRRKLDADQKRWQAVAMAVARILRAQ